HSVRMTLLVGFLLENPGDCERSTGSLLIGDRAPEVTDARRVERGEWVGRHVSVLPRLEAEVVNAVSNLDAQGGIVRGIAGELARAEVVQHQRLVFTAGSRRDGIELRECVRHLMRCLIDEAR